MKTSIIITHEGWLLFCPIYWAEDEEQAIAKNDRWWLFDIAVVVHGFRNNCLLVIGRAPSFPYHLVRLSQPKVITYNI